MTTFAPHRDTLGSFVDCIHSGADKDTLDRLLAENGPRRTRASSRSA